MINQFKRYAKNKLKITKNNMSMAKLMREKVNTKLKKHKEITINLGVVGLRHGEGGRLGGYDDLVTMEDIDNLKLETHDRKLKMGVNTLTKGGDFKMIRDLNLKEQLIKVGALKVKKQVGNALNLYRF